MKKIQLGGHNKVRGKYQIRGYVLVDDRDFQYFNQWNWQLNAQGYASRCEKGKTIRMHRLINKTPNGLETDHINRNTLDNRRKNLRTVTRALNTFNRVGQKNNTSGYKGISWEKDYKKWGVYIWKNYKKIHLGYFNDILKANLARKKAERIYVQY